MPTNTSVYKMKLKSNNLMQIYSSKQTKVKPNSLHCLGMHGLYIYRPVLMVYLS